MGVFIIIIIIIGIIFIALVSNANQNHAEYLEEVESKIKDLNIDEPTEKIIGTSISYILITDDKNQTLTIAYKDYTVSLKYNEIIGMEITNNNQMVSQRSTSSTIGRAVVGGVLLGGVGAIIGGVTGKLKEKQYASRVCVKIQTNNANKPNFEIYTFDAMSMCGSRQINSKDSDWYYYEKGLTQAEQIETIISKIIATNGTTKTIEQTNYSKVDELMKLGALLKEGLLTQEEFETEKHKLINNAEKQFL